jgi:hypothetical protein
MPRRFGILRQLEWSCQRPAGSALERDEEKIRTWKQKRWPEWKLPDVGRVHDLKDLRRRRFGDLCMQELLHGTRC